MIQLFGNIFLYCALISAGIQSFLPLTGFFKNKRAQSFTKANTKLIAFARPAALAQFVFISIGYGLLTLAFATNDLSIAYVAENSHPLLPLMYRLTAVWGAHEGSILFWILLLNTWTMIYAISQRSTRDIKTSLTYATLGLISFCFLCFLIFTSNPFVTAATLTEGYDLNPLLQDPGLVIHPPMLYIGYVGLSVAFAITQAALLCQSMDASWARLTRQFATAAWCFLTFGIALGSWWAYRVLGWGGFWFWDPVENASLLPWLASTAFIHIMILVEKRGNTKAWAAFLAIICFSLSLLGTFLVRSGILVSAHTFASDPQRGVFLLIMLGILLTATLALFVARLPYLTTTADTNVSVCSRETALLTNSGLLFVAMLTVLLGTLYPLITDAFHLGVISVGAPYFNKVMMPLTFIALFLMGFAPYCHWRTQSIKSLWKHTRAMAALSVVLAIIILSLLTRSISPYTFITLALSIWVILSVVKAWRTLPGMAIAHVGFAVLIIGIMLSSVLNQERDIRMKIGDSVKLGPYEFIFIGIQGVAGSNYKGIQAAFDVAKGNRHITTLYPEKRIFTVREMVMTKVAIEPGIFRDLYIALGQPLRDDEWSVRIYYKPFIRWVWMGGLLMMLGGFVSIAQRKKR